MSIFKIFFKSLYSFSEYKDFIKMSKLKTYLYIVLLSFVLIIPSIIPTVKIIKTSKQFISSIPNLNFDIIDGNFYIYEEDYYYQLDDSTTIVISNSDDSLEYYLSKSQFSENVIIVTPAIIYFRANDNEKIYNMSHVLNSLNIYSKEDVIAIFDLILEVFDIAITIGFITGALILLTLFQIFITIGALIISAMAKALFFTPKDNISYNDSFKIVILASTFPTTLSIFLPINILIRIGIIIMIYYFVSKEIKNL